jgi:hypothetical protein
VGLGFSDMAQGSFLSPSQDIIKLSISIYNLQIGRYFSVIARILHTIINRLTAVDQVEVIHFITLDSITVGSFLFYIPDEHIIILQQFVCRQNSILLMLWSFH